MQNALRTLKTELSWKDLVLPPATLKQLEEVAQWVEHRQQVSPGHPAKRLKPGYKALFHGPPGTGKTLTASLIGKRTGRQVYSIDLSALLSKYAGETEKNVELLFEQANQKDAILFFDEADALFGKKTTVKDAHDRYANQEVAYLLQKIEDYEGLIILSANMKNNIDPSFLRRFRFIIQFPFPGDKKKKTFSKTL